MHLEDQCIIYSFLSKYRLCIYNIPGTVLGAGEAVVNITGSASIPEVRIYRVLTEQQELTDNEYFSPDHEHLVKSFALQV